ncbi:hypothetical protein [Crossiella sp. CA198]|uniref:hypothetical protein n=1 Tax=Crossiella sp. CA198 TaxID=3455607 RepID=UPI003F8D6274
MNTCSRTRFAAGIIGALLILATGTIVIGLIVRLVFPVQFSAGDHYRLSPFGIGFGVSAIYLAWLGYLALRRRH